MELSFQTAVILLWGIIHIVLMVAFVRIGRKIYAQQLKKGEALRRSFLVAFLLWMNLFVVAYITNGPTIPRLSSILLALGMILGAAILALICAVAFWERASRSWR